MMGGKGRRSGGCVPLRLTLPAASLPWRRAGGWRGMGRGAAGTAEGDTGGSTASGSPAVGPALRSSDQDEGAGSVGSGPAGHQSQPFLGYDLSSFQLMSSCPSSSGLTAEGLLPFSQHSLQLRVKSPQRGPQVVQHRDHCHPQSPSYCQLSLPFLAKHLFFIFIFLGLRRSLSVG